MTTAEELMQAIEQRNTARARLDHCDPRWTDAAVYDLAAAEERLRRVLVEARERAGVGNRKCAS